MQTDQPVENGDKKEEKPEEKKDTPKKKNKVKSIDLAITANVPSMSKEDLNSFMEKEVNLKQLFLHWSTILILALSV